MPGPVTVTTSEAARRVLQAAAIGESGQVLDIGEPAKTVGLARDLIRLSGHAADEIAVVYSGLRPGEKLFEEPLALADDDDLPTQVPAMRAACLHAQAAVQSAAPVPGQVLRQRPAQLLPDFVVPQTSVFSAH